VAHALQVAPPKPVLQAQVHAAGASLTESACALQELVVSQETQVG
jgi:hypothetical protein